MTTVDKPHKADVAKVIADLKAVDDAFNAPLITSFTRSNIACQYFAHQNGGPSFMKQVIELLEAMNN